MSATTTTGYVLRCPAGHIVEASTRLADCPPRRLRGQDLERIRQDGTRHPRQAD